MLTASLNGALGLIPDWQFSANPAINPMLNPHVNMPEGWTQAYTVQPYGASMAPVSIPIPSPLYGARSGLGYIMIDRGPSAAATAAQAAMAPPVPLAGATLGNWAWDHRKGLALGAVAVVGVALLGGLSAILK